MESEYRNNPEREQEPVLDRPRIIGLMQELGIDIEGEDTLDEDDNDLMGVIATYAYMYDGDVDEYFAYLGVPVALRRDP